MGTMVGAAGGCSGVQGCAHLSLLATLPPSSDGSLSTGPDKESSQEAGDGGGDTLGSMAPASAPWADHCHKPLSSSPDARGALGGVVSQLPSPAKPRSSPQLCCQIQNSFHGPPKWPAGSFGKNEPGFKSRRK